MKAWLCIALLGTQLAAAAPTGEMTLRAEQRSAGSAGPLAAAARLQASPPSPEAGALLQLELRDTRHLELGNAKLGLHGNALLAHQHLNRGAGGTDLSRINELHVTLDAGAWQLAAGKKVLGWDVGYGFRPNDVVQQEQRRTQFGQTPEGRPLLMAEHFSAATAWSLVWVNPQRGSRTVERQRGAGESALAARVYHHAGAVDWHGFARLGRHSGASLGTALAWVASDSLALHASARLLQRHEAWQGPGDTPPLLRQRDPWQRALRGHSAQWLLGLQWTGEQRQSLLLEAWHDGTALPEASWQQWQSRNAGLLALAQAQPSFGAAVAGNLGWQASPLASSSLRRDNLFARLSWQHEDWELSLDGLWQPEDGGRIVTAGLQWQGDRWRVNASWRQFGGPAQALLAQLPLRRSLLVAATRSF